MKSRSLLAATAATAVCAALMEVPWLDPATGRGRTFAMIFNFTLCAGLLLWALGAVRRHRSQFGLKTAIIAMTLIALLLGALRVLPPYVPGLAFLALGSVLMLREAAMPPSPPAAFRSIPSRVVIGMAGALGTAHILRFVVHGLLRW